MQAELDVLRALTGQLDRLRGTLYARRRRNLFFVQVGLAALGVALICLWWFTNDWSTMSMMFVLMGVTLLSAALMLYLFFPGRYLHSDVYNALCTTDVLTLGKVLSSMLISSRGIYVPAKLAGRTRLFLPLSEVATIDGIPALAAEGQSFFSVSGKDIKGVVIDPPGLGLFHQAYSMGAIFLSDHLENEIKDVMENGMELATRVSLKINGDTVQATLEDIACKSMCESIRLQNPAICSQIGCPVCSFVGCMVADGTGKMARVETVEVTGRKIFLTFELLGSDAS